MKSKSIGADALWLSRAGRTADKVLAHADSLRGESDERLAELSAELKSEGLGASQRMLDSLLVRAFGLVVEAARRVTGLSMYREQVIAGIALHEGHIAQQNTGEGKTLTASMPAYLHALTGRGVHVVTVNPYLAQRDAENIGRIHNFLGMTVGCVTAGQRGFAKKHEYACDITYVSNTELGFDYLRDNMAVSQSNVVQRGLVYAIVDEVDSILIDEAKTPLIIAGQGTDVSKIYKAVDSVVSKLELGSESRAFNKAEAYLGIPREETGDVIVHEKEKNVMLTESGIAKVEKGLGIENYADARHRSIQHTVEQSLRAHWLMHKGKDYIVRNGKIEIVDENTGRVMQGRNFSDGLHQAIEAKEHVEVTEMFRTIGTTSYQNFFRKYELLSGMTGTAWTERNEFKSTYGLSVKVIPPHKPVIRVDEPDRLFITKAGKYKSVIERIREESAKGRPILAGTASVEESEALSKLLSEAGIRHQVLNAKQDKAEADIIAQAGIHGTVTVATNMAGRGTDIILDDESREAGGLFVIGTEKHESKRIDNQLRGRSGRQGDPGTSAFYISWEDRVMRLYGADRYKSMLESYRSMLEKDGLDPDAPLDSKSMLRSIDKAQKRVAADNFAARRDTLEYDDVNDMQRERIYKERRIILAKDNVDEQFAYAVGRFCEDLSGECKDKDELSKRFKGVSDVEIPASEITVEKMKSAILGAFEDMDFVDEASKESYFRRCLLTAVDTAWSEQLKALEFCRDAVSYSGFGHRDSKAVYAHESYRLYERMQHNIYALAVVMALSERLGGVRSVDIGGISIRIERAEGMEV